MRLLVWLFRAFVFFALFAFALNNQQLATVNWFFGAQWQVPLVLLVLVVFAAGCAAGVLAMLPVWWRQRRLAQAAEPLAPAPSAPAAAVAASADPIPEHPSRVGL